MKQNRSPKEGLQFFGIGRIDARTRAMTVSLHGIDGQQIFRVDLPPET
jgi:alkaline phosphatase D